MLANITCHLAEISKSDVLNAAQTTSIFSALSPSINKTWGALHDARGKPVWWTILKLFPYVTTKCRRIKGLTAQTDTPRGDSRSFSLWEYYAFQYEIGLFSDCVSCKKVRS